MKQNWTTHELQEQWTISPIEAELLRSKSTRWRLGFALQWKFFEIEHRFPDETAELPATVAPGVRIVVASDLLVLQKNFQALLEGADK